MRPSIFPSTETMKRMLPLASDLMVFKLLIPMPSDSSLLNYSIIALRISSSLPLLPHFCKHNMNECSTFPPRSPDSATCGRQGPAQRRVFVPPQGASNDSFFFPSAAHPVDWHRIRAGSSAPSHQTETSQPNDFDDITSF